MSQDPHDPSDHRPDQEFDTSAELWDRIVDDIARQGSPCLDTVQELVDQACYRSPGTQNPKSQQD